MNDRQRHHDRLRAALDRDDALVTAARRDRPREHHRQRGGLRRLPRPARCGGAGSEDDPDRADFLPGRPNVWGERQGAGGGHAPAVHRSHRHRPCGRLARALGRAPSARTRSPRRSSTAQIWGRGAGDLKAGICRQLAALGVLDRAGVRLAGDVAFAFVGDEESGQPGTGVSAGVKRLRWPDRGGRGRRAGFRRLRRADAACGLCGADRLLHRRDHRSSADPPISACPNSARDALKAAHAVLTALWAHSDAVAARAEHPLVGRGFLLVTGIEGGGFIAVPERCTLSLIRKLLPGESLDAAAAGAGGGGAWRGHRSRDPHRDRLSGGPRPCARRHAAETDPNAAAVAPPRRRGWGDAWSGAADRGRALLVGGVVLRTALGVPAVYCAPGDIRNCHTFEEHVEVEEYFAGVARLRPLHRALLRRDGLTELKATGRRSMR